MSWQTGVPAGKAKQKRRRASRPAAPAEQVQVETSAFVNRHGYTLRRCECGRAVLLIHEACIVCDVNSETKKRIGAREAAAA